MKKGNSYAYCQEKYDHMTDPKYELPDDEEPKITRRKFIPGWYRMMIDRRIKKLLAALTELEYAERALNLGYPKSAKKLLQAAKKIIN